METALILRADHDSVIAEAHRCLVPVCKFYEWKQFVKRKKEKYEFFVPGEILCLVGIYHKDPERDRFTILIWNCRGKIVKRPGIGR